MKKNLTLELADARKLYKTASGEFKQMLELNFGKEELVGNITDRIKTWKDIENYVMENNITLYDEYKGTWANYLSLSFLKIKMLEFTLNEGQTPKLGEKRWYPYFNLKAVSLVFGYSDCTCAGSLGAVAYFNTEKLANYAGTQFINLFEAVIK